MKKLTFSILTILLTMPLMNAQNPVKVGAGSYAEYTPLYKSRTSEHNGDQSRIMENRTLYITEKSKGLPVPTNDWWTDLIIEKYSGNLWAYPQVVNAEEYGIYVAYPNRWTDDGREMKWDTQLEVLGKQFKPESAAANTWHDWGLDFLMKDNEKEMLVTLAHGVPFTWVETKNIDLQLRVKNASFHNQSGQIQFPYTGSSIVIEMENDTYGIYAPDGTIFDLKDNIVTVKFKGSAQYISIGVLPDKESLSTFGEYAYTVPRKTDVIWNYNENQGTVLTQWKITTENLKGGTQKNVLQGFIPHHYKNSQYDMDFTSYEYATPRGKMRMAAGNTFNITYKFNGILPHYALPKENLTLKNQFNRDRMKQMISEYAQKGGFGADTYWGGKGLTQMALYMTFAYEMGEMELFEQCKARLKDALTNWLTFTPGEQSFFFARYNKWKALVGYDTSYDSDTFNDHHFHYGYFTYACGLLALFDEDFKSKYGEMAMLLAKEYANWDKNDREFPFMRTLDPWAGHSYAGGLGGWNGNGQESSSEAMQGWGGVYMLGVATGNDAMRDAGIFGWTLEARGIAEYWYDRDRENIDYTKYDKPYNSNLTSQGIGWWTWFSGDPVWMHSIQWMPISPILKYLYEDTDFARWDYTQMWNSKEVGDWTTQSGLSSSLSYESGLGNVVLSYLQIFDTDSVASIFDRMWDANMPVVKNPDTGGITYFLTHSNRTYGNICWDIYGNVPTSTTYKHPQTGVYTFMVYNPNNEERVVSFYQNGIKIKEFKAPAHKLTAYSDASFIAAVSIANKDKVVEPGKTLQLEAVLLDQYGATMNGTITWNVINGGTISSDALFTAQSNKGFASIVASNGVLKDTLELRIDDKPVLTEVKMLPQNQEYIEIGNSVDFSLLTKDQYGNEFPVKAVWQISRGGQVVKNDSVFDLQQVGVYTVKATIGDKIVTQDVYLSPKFANIALNKNVTVSSVENAGTLAKHATDGNMTSRWGSQHSDPQWIYVDLGVSAYISYVSLVWEPAYASLYEIQVSDNALNWETVKRIVGLGKTETTEVNKTARYVRMYGLERATTYGYSLYEFEVYGVLPMGDTPTLFGIDIQPRSGQIKEGEPVKLEVKGYDQFGNELPISPVFSLISGEGTIVNGVFTPAKYGNASIQVKVGDKTTKAEFLVEESIKLTSVSIQPQKVALIKGNSIDFACEGKDQFGANYPVDELAFSIIGEGAFMNSSTFTSDQAGIFKVVVGNGTVSDTAIVTVTNMEETNLALLKPVYASSYENAGTLPSFVNDGDLNTRWGSQFSEPENIYVDLLDSYIIDEVKLFWDGAYANSYKIEVSLNEEDWNTVYENTNSPGGNQIVELDPVATRYVRINCLNRATQWGSSIKELEVYGISLWKNPQPAAIRINTDLLVAYIGEDLQIKAQLLDQYGLDYENESGFEWSVTGGGTISQNGLFTPSVIGDYRLKVKYKGLEITEVIRVVEARQIVGIELSEGNALVRLQDELQIKAESVNQYGERADINPVWEASGGNITENGVFSSSVAGIFDITARYGDFTAYAIIQVYDAQENIALNKPVESSSGEVNAAFAVDGNNGTRWESAFRDGPEWLLIDLQDAYVVTDIEIVWEGASAADYEVQISKDGENWETMKALTGLKDGRTDLLKAEGLGRYLRVWCTKRSTVYGYSIWELRAYGLKIDEMQPYNIEFINPETSAEVGVDVQYTVEVTDKNNAIIDPVLLWSVSGAGTIKNGLFKATLSGEIFINAYSGFAKKSIPVKVNFPAVSIEKISSEEIYVYPNPVKNILKISDDVKVASLYNMIGQLIKVEYNVNEIDMSDLKDGFYLLKIQSVEGKQINKKVLLSK